MKLCTKCNNEKDGNHGSYCKSCNNKQATEYQQNNKKKTLEYAKEYYQNNKKKVLERNKEYYQSNKEQIKESKKEYRKNNPHKTREYKQNNPHKGREADRKRRALKQKNIHKPYTEDQVLEKYGTNCHICKEDINLLANRSAGAPGWERGLHLDHVIPLSKGGPDSLNNVKPAHGSCNLQKHDSILSSR